MFIDDVENVSFYFSDEKMQIAAIEEMQSTETETGNVTGTETGTEKKTETEKAEETKTRIGKEKREGTRILAETMNEKDESTGKVKVGTRRILQKRGGLKEIGLKEIGLEEIGLKRIDLKRIGLKRMKIGGEGKTNEREIGIEQVTGSMKGTERSEEKRTVAAEINLQRKYGIMIVEKEDMTQRREIDGSQKFPNPRKKIKVIDTDPGGKRITTLMIGLSKEIARK